MDQSFLVSHLGCWFHGGTGAAHGRHETSQMRSSLVGRGNVGQETVGKAGVCTDQSLAKVWLMQVRWCKV